MTFYDVLQRSRPRFWIYLLGPFVVGLALSGSLLDLSTQEVVLVIATGLFFTLPANLFVYGVNDIHDYETDIRNPKKRGYERVLAKKDHRQLQQYILVMSIPFLALLFFFDQGTMTFFLIFVLTGYLYSVPPLRAKTKPPLDVIFSSLIYLSPSLIAFTLIGEGGISWIAVLAAFLWTQAMQTYSAVPDIEADRETHTDTLATLLGKKNALIFCALSYGLASVLVATQGYLLIASVSLIYVVLMLMALYRNRLIFKIYTYFPLINTLFGMGLFFAVLFA